MNSETFSEMDDDDDDEVGKSTKHENTCPTH